MQKAVLTIRVSPEYNSVTYILTIRGDPLGPVEFHDKGRALAWAQGRGVKVVDRTEID